MELQLISKYDWGLIKQQYIYIYIHNDFKLRSQNFGFEAQNPPWYKYIDME